MNHVIEHVVDPVRFLRTCLQMLRPGGTLICVTPNAEQLGAPAPLASAGWRSTLRAISTLFTLSSLQTAAKLAGHPDPQVYTSCANAQAFAVGSFEIASTGRYAMGRRSAWRSELLLCWHNFARLRRFAGNPESGDELILRCYVKA